MLVCIHSKRTYWAPKYFLGSGDQFGESDGSAVQRIDSITFSVLWAYIYRPLVTQLCLFLYSAGRFSGIKIGWNLEFFDQKRNPFTAKGMIKFVNVFRLKEKMAGYPFTDLNITTVPLS